MKLVVKVGSTGLDRVLDAHTLAHAVSDLLSDGHQVTIIHREDTAIAHIVRDSSISQEPAGTPGFRGLTGRVNRRLVAALASAGVPAFGLCATDGNIVRVRNKRSSNGNQFSGEAASVDAFWINTIARNGGVPVLANIGLGPDREYHWLDADQMASACAIGWNADALIFLTNGEIPHNADGSPMRWLDAEKVDDLFGHGEISQSIRSKLNACREALKCGVRRTRILPLAHGESLSCFYSVRIESGTEVILAV